MVAVRSAALHDLPLDELDALVGAENADLGHLVVLVDREQARLRLLGRVLGRLVGDAVRGARSIAIGPVLRALLLRLSSVPAALGTAGLLPDGGCAKLTLSGAGPILAARGGASLPCPRPDMTNWFYYFSGGTTELLVTQ